MGIGGAAERMRQKRRPRTRISRGEAAGGAAARKIAAEVSTTNPYFSRRSRRRCNRPNECGRSVDQEHRFLPSGSSESPTHNERRRRELCGWDGWTDGWMDGWTGHQKCPSIFLILMYVEDHIYMYLYTYSKVVTKILMGFKI